MESYKRNRTRVFEIYGINSKDPNYNCHHIVTRSDKKRGLVSPDFHIDDKSNLYPSLISVHNNLHRRLLLLESPTVAKIPITPNFQRINLDMNFNCFIDENIFRNKDHPCVREKSVALQFLVWQHQGVL